MTKGNKREANELRTQSLKTKKQNGLFLLISSNLVSNVENTRKFRKLDNFVIRRKALLKNLLVSAGTSQGQISSGNSHGSRDECTPKLNIPGNN